MDDTKKKKGGLDEDEIDTPSLGTADAEADEVDDEYIDGKPDSEEEY